MTLPMAKPWFSEGLRFKCTGCGQCCTGAPGHVWINEEEIAAIEAYLQRPRSTFIRYVRGAYSLIEHSKTYDCVFLKDKKCSIYSLRPRQCRTYPWWLSNLESKSDWDDAAQVCEGINHPDAPLIPLSVIAEGFDADI